jgi:quinol monooxygenase YgiN
MSRQVKVVLALFAALTHTVCAMEANLGQKTVVKQENVSYRLLQERFSDLEAVRRYLDSESVEYLIEADSIGKEPPKSKAVAWNEADGMYYLVLLPRNPTKLYRFRIYPVGERSLHVEADYGYKNPYQ